MIFPTQETARSKAGRALGTEKDFWERQDLIYIGDLSWTGEDKPEGFEYISSPIRSGEKFKYVYGMIIISGKNVINELVCKIEGPLDQSQTFMMEVQGQWFNGPLENWLKTMTASQQK